MQIFNGHISCHAAIMRKHDVIHKTGSLLCTATPPEQDRARVISNVQKLVKLSCVVFELCERTDRQKQTYILDAILHNRSGAEHDRSMMFQLYYRLYIAGPYPLKVKQPRSL